MDVRTFVRVPRDDPSSRQGVRTMRADPALHELRSQGPRHAALVPRVLPRLLQGVRIVHRQQSRQAAIARCCRAQAHVTAHLLQNSCVDCSEPDPVVLEFDHVAVKDRGLADLIHDGVSNARLDDEIARCEVVCANCHRRRTSTRANAFRVAGTIEKIARLRPRRARNLRYVVDLLERASCVDCGLRDPLVLEFDHFGPKRAAVSNLAWFEYSLEMVVREIDVCQVRCRNCHRRRTARDGQHLRHRLLESGLQTAGDPPPRPTE